MGQVVVELLGRRLVLEADYSQEHMDSLVALVSERAKEIDPTGAIPEVQRAILTLLNIADELDRERSQLAAFRREVAAKSSFLLEKLSSYGYAPQSRSDLQGGG